MHTTSAPSMVCPCGPSSFLFLHYLSLKTRIVVIACPRKETWKKNEWWWYRGWTRFILPSIFAFLAVFMLWYRHFAKGKTLEALRVMPPPNRNTVELLLALQEFVSQIEGIIQDANIILLKTRALIFSMLPQVCSHTTPFLDVLLPFSTFNEKEYPTCKHQPPPSSILVPSFPAVHSMFHMSK